MSEISRCVLCGEPMPAGEEMFKFHGYSGSCPKPPLPKVEKERELASQQSAVAREPECVTRWMMAEKQRIDSVGVYNARVKLTREHAIGKMSVDHEYQAMERARRGSAAALKSMYEELSTRPTQQADEGAGCNTCGGHGLVGGFVGGTDTGGYQSDPCPDCNTPPPSPASGELWYLQDSRSFVGNDVLWWRKGGNGYTTDLRDAETYTHEQAEQKRRSREGDIPWPKEYIDSKSRPTVDFQQIDMAHALFPSSSGELCGCKNVSDCTSMSGPYSATGEKCRYITLNPIEWKTLPAASDKPSAREEIRTVNTPEVDSRSRLKRLAIQSGAPAPTFESAAGDKK